MLIICVCIVPRNLCNTIRSMRRLVSSSVPFRGSQNAHTRTHSRIVRACMRVAFYATATAARSAWARVGTLVFVRIEVGRDRLDQTWMFSRDALIGRLKLCCGRCSTGERRLAPFSPNLQTFSSRFAGDTRLRSIRRSRALSGR